MPDCGIMIDSYFSFSLITGILMSVRAASVATVTVLVKRLTEASDAAFLTTRLSTGRLTTKLIAILYIDYHLRHHMSKR